MPDAPLEIEFRCFNCETVNPLDPARGSCSGCGTLLVDADGIFSLVRNATKSDERRFYDEEYRGVDANPGRRQVSSLRSLWLRKDAQQNRLLRAEVESLTGKDVLLIGNGASLKELVFLEERPRRLVYSDLSANASRAIQRQFDLDAYRTALRFAAIDAEELPFVDQSFDLVYGHAMVHHLPDIAGFLRQAYRVLKPGGKAVFMDDAYAPVWHYSKQTWLKPLMKYSHKRTGISPEDYRFSMSGGFREEELGALIGRLPATPYFRRACLLDYVWRRGAEKLLPAALGRTLTSDASMAWIVRLDERLSALAWYRRNQIRLVWGFVKGQAKLS